MPELSKEATLVVDLVILFENKYKKFEDASEPVIK